MSDKTSQLGEMIAETILASHVFVSLKSTGTGFDTLKEIKEQVQKLDEENTDSVVLITLKKGSEGVYCNDCGEEHFGVVLDMVAVGGPSQVSAMLMLGSCRVISDSGKEPVPSVTN